MSVLFLKDWGNTDYFGSIIDTKTSNKSFLRMAGLYKKMNIKNHAFFLVLLNPNLQGVDPYDENLTDELKYQIAREVRDNPWYFFREVLRVPPVAGTDSVPLRANRFIIAALWLALNHITTYTIIPRQLGKSILGNALDMYNLNIGSSNSDITILTKDDKLRTRTAASIRDLLELLPPYLQLMSKKDIKNTEKLTVKALGNMINIYVGQRDKKAADNLGRGQTLPIIRVDEFAYIYNIETSLPVLLAASVAAREEAKRVNAPYYTMFTTTPGKLNSPDGKFAYRVYNESLRWNEKYFDLENLEELETVMDKNTKHFKVMLLEFNHRQLGFTDKWLKIRMDAALSSGENAESDYLNKWINGNVTSPIPKELLDIIVDSKKTKYNPFVSKYGYIIKWYVDNKKLEYMKQHNYLVIGLDTSDALGGKNDDIGLVIRDSRTGAVVGAGIYNETNLSMFSDFLVEILEEFPNSVLIPERKSSAMAILDNMFRIMLVKRMNPFKRIFNWTVNNGTSESIKILNKMPDMDFINKHKRQFGFATSSGGATSRGLLYGNVFRTSLTYTSDKVYDPTLIAQLGGLKIMNNRIDHEVGSHDDLVISWLLAFYLLQHGKNTEFYGLHHDSKLNDLLDNELMSKNPNVDQTKIKEQTIIKDTIELLVRKLTKTTDNIIGYKLISKIKFYENQLDKTIITNFNIENLLKDIKLYKKIQRNKRR